VAQDSLDPDLAGRIERELSLLRPTRLTTGAMAWGDGPDPEKFWIPEDMAPLWGSPEYAGLTPAQRRRYNQYCALHKAESFIWLEHEFVIAPLTKILDAGVPGTAFRALIDSFVADERAHSAALGRLLELARPDIYKSKTYYFFVPSARFRLATALIAGLPRLLSGWVLFLAGIEESTITTSQCYRQAGEAVDRVFTDLHVLHAQDEARHCKLDALIAEWLISRQTGWKQRVNAKMLDFTFQSYFDPRWGYTVPVERLVSDFPELGAREDAMLARTQEAMTPSLVKFAAEGEAAPITASNAKKFDMLETAIEHLFTGQTGARPPKRKIPRLSGQPPAP
jgi:P-aminobenzoate N-oxygenase AurF